MITWLIIVSYCFATNFREAPGDNVLRIITVMLLIEALIELPVIYRKMILES